MIFLLVGADEKRVMLTPARLVKVAPLVSIFTLLSDLRRSALRIYINKRLVFPLKCHTDVLILTTLVLLYVGTLKIFLGGRSNFRQTD